MSPGNVTRALPTAWVSSSRLYDHPVIDYDANMGGLCQLHGSRSHGFGFYSTRQRHFIFRYIRSNAQFSPSHLFVLANMDFTAFSSLAFAALGLPRPVGEEAAWASAKYSDARQSTKALIPPSATMMRNICLEFMAVSNRNSHGRRSNAL